MLITKNECICKSHCYTAHYIIKVLILLPWLRSFLCLHVNITYIYMYKSSTHIVDYIYIYINNAYAPTLDAFAPTVFMVWLWDWYQILRCMHGPLRSNPIYLLVSWCLSSLRSSASLIWASKFLHTLHGPTCSLQCPQDTILSWLNPLHTSYPFS